MEKLEAEFLQYQESDEPEFRKFLARRFGAEQTRQRELAEKIDLLQVRYEKICFMADNRGMSKGHYCFSLSEKVTPEQDFWALLEQDLLDFQEQERKRQEAFERELEEARKNAGFEEEAADDDWDFNDDDDDDDDDDDWKRAKREFKQLFGDEFGDFSEPEVKTDDQDLKKLYRELCLRYHPDIIGAHDVRTQRVWLSIQSAYRDGDVVRLRSIHTGIELESGKTELGCSEIGEIIAEVEWGIREKRAELRKMKQVPYWGFSSWTEKKRQTVELEIRKEFEYGLKKQQLQLEQMEYELNRICHSYKPKPKKKTKKELRREAISDIPDLFG